jgi:hypothetical protein
MMTNAQAPFVRKARKSPQGPNRTECKVGFWKVTLSCTFAWPQGNCSMQVKEGECSLSTAPRFLNPATPIAAGSGIPPVDSIGGAWQPFVSCRIQVVRVR